MSQAKTTHSLGAQSSSNLVGVANTINQTTHVHSQMRKHARIYLWCAHGHVDGVPDVSCLWDALYFQHHELCLLRTSGVGEPRQQTYCSCAHSSSASTGMCDITASSELQYLLACHLGLVLSFGFHSIERMRVWLSM